MPLFEIARTTKQDDLAIAKKSNAKQSKSVATKRSGDILSIMNDAKALVNEKLGHLKDNYEVIRDLTALNKYIDKCIENDVIAIDTETTGLDPISDKIVGICLYTPNAKACYVPINHISYITNERLDNQLSEEQVKTALDRLGSTKVIMFNATFDIRVLRNQCNVYLNCYWDAYLGARCLNENEDSNQLKKLHQKYVLKNAEDEFSFGELFRGITFDKVPIDTAYIYASHDAIITYELYKFQEPFLDVNSEREDLRNVAWVFRNIEMPIVNVVCNMEDSGIELDMKYANELSVKYNALLEEKKQAFYDELTQYQSMINDYKKTHTKVKLDNPISIGSPQQIATLLYDILGCESVDERNARGTGEDILKKIDLPITKCILEYREVAKLVSTYIDKLPECVNEKTARIHCRFNQYGADTGRFSCDRPNLQNIPSHNTDIRKMFKAKDGYVLMSSDYASQEPKCLAALCRLRGDSQMYDVFMEGKDLYSEIASKAFHKTYEECREFNTDGTTNKEGKDRRTRAKSILLGVLYGRGEESIAEQLKCSVEEAKEIKDSVFNAFPAIRKFEKDSINMAKDVGYVTTICGRKRRLFDMQLPVYEFEYRGDADVLDFSEETTHEVPQYLKDKYLAKLSRAYGSQKRKIFEEANAEGVWIVDNGKKISEAIRQCVNARIQGSAADLTKAAMIALDNSEKAKEIDMHILIPVHDELIVECPEKYMKEGKELLASTMSKAAEDILQMPIRCDVAISRCWYGEEIDV